jgi:glycosyltransferase 2 family protein
MAISTATFAVWSLFVKRQSFHSLLRWVVLVATLGFLGITLSKHWQEVQTLQLRDQAWLYGSAALGTALLAQLWSACVWGWILAALQQRVPRRWSMVVVLKNTPAKYIPGSIWHLYGRVHAARKKGITLELATLSVILEPLFVIAGALGLTFLSAPYPRLQGLGLGVILLAAHPRILNLIWRWGNRLRGKSSTPVCMEHYPLRVFLGAVAFMTLRSLAFMLVVLAFTPLSWEVLRPLLGGFSFAWLLSLIAPAPGGLGVFEASTIAVLDGFLAPGLLLGAVAAYRLISLSSEILGAALAYLVKEGSDA